MIFNGDRYAPRPSRSYAPPQGSAYADPSNPNDRPVYAPSGGAPQVSHGGGRGVAYCVRTCDGRYFPVSGTRQDERRRRCAGRSVRGADPDFLRWRRYRTAGRTERPALHRPAGNAFVYRERWLDGLKCNSKSPIGLVRFGMTWTIRPCGRATSCHKRKRPNEKTYRNDGQGVEKVFAGHGYARAVGEAQGAS